MRCNRLAFAAGASPLAGENPESFLRAKRPLRPGDSRAKKAQARCAGVPLRCDASIERSDS